MALVASIKNCGRKEQMKVRILKRVTHQEDKRPVTLAENHPGGAETKGPPRGHIPQAEFDSSHRQRKPSSSPVKRTLVRDHD